MTQRTWLNEFVIVKRKPFERNTFALLRTDLQDTQQLEEGAGSEPKNEK